MGGKTKDFFTARFARDAEDAEENLLLKNREMPIFQKNLAACGGFMVFFRPLSSVVLISEALTSAIRPLSLPSSALCRPPSDFLPTSAQSTFG